MKEQNQPAVGVSVVMPAYNAERYLETAVRSVMEQTYSDWELLLLDDCSQDGTWELAQRLAQEDPRIRPLRNTENKGVAQTRNLGFSLSRGAYVALLDSDDLWHPQKLELQLQLAEQTGADVIYCSYGMIDEQGRQKCADFIVPPETDLKASLVQSVISCSTALLSCKVVQEHRFRREYYHEDLVLWLELLREGCRACGVTQVLAQYRLLQNARSAGKLRCALRRWPVYRKFMGYSLWRSAWLLMRYGILAVLKYSAK